VNCLASFVRIITLHFSDTIMNKSVMKSTVIVNLVFFLLLSGCVSQNEVASLDTRMSELEIRNAEAKKHTRLTTTADFMTDLFIKVSLKWRVIIRTNDYRQFTQ